MSSVLWGCLAPFGSLASTADALADFFDDLGLEANRTAASAYAGQAANYYTGGNLMVRAPASTLEFGQLQPPSMRAGCGGIDLFYGGLSHIKADALIQFGKTVVAEAPAFFADLALQTWAPQIKSIRDQLQAVSDKFLNQAINSCETAQAGVAALAGFAEVGSQKYICESMATQDNVFADWVEAQHQCGRDPQTEKILSKARSDPHFADMVKRDRNLVWEALKQLGYLRYDKELRQLFMSLAGTVIYDSDGESKGYPSLLEHQSDAVPALLEGGELTMYRCHDADRCLRMSTTQVRLRPTQGLIAKVDGLLTNMVAKLQADEPLDQATQSFLAYTQWPVLKLLLNQLYDQTTPNTREYARMLALELVQIYLSQILQTVEQTLLNTHNDPNDIERIQAAIHRSQTYVAQLSESAQATALLKQTIIDSARVSDVWRAGQLAGALQSSLEH